MLRTSSLVSIALLLVPLASQAQHSTGYAELKSREIKALSSLQITELRDGRGMGLSLPAELNGTPGPLHVLELQEALALTGKQALEVTQIRDDMKSSAQQLGAAIVEEERRLERLFEGGRSPDTLRIRNLTARIGQLNAELRAVHLVAHVQTRRILSERQVVAYNSARGYTSESGEAARPPQSHAHPASSHHK